ncbi:MAG TPA: helix-turn-helix domain-containing protein [Thermoplasmata archaeon]|nr:helix-turn-helix domain-containing protein [Thermoplasmata archaeon]
MLSQPDRLRTLREFGLTDYQAKAYLGLLEIGRGSASEVARVSRVPRTRIYVTMNQLHEKGLARIIPESPLKYEPVRFGEFLAGRATRMREEAERIERDQESIGKQFLITPKTVERGGQFEVLYGRRNVKERLSRMYEMSKAHIIVVGTHTTPVRVARTNLPLLEDQIARGVKVEFAYPVTEGNTKDSERMKKAGVKVFPLDRDPPMHFVVVDQTDALLIHRIPDDENPYRGDDVAIWTSDPAIVKAMDQIAGRYLEPSV